MTFESSWNGFLFGVGNDIVNELVKTVPVDKGTLKASINHSTNGNIITISMLEYGMYLEFGTPPHIIRVKDKKVLSDGKSFFGKEVHHPGTRPNPFIRTAFETKLPKIIEDNTTRHLK